MRYRIVTIHTLFGQLMDRCGLTGSEQAISGFLTCKSSRLLCKALMHSLAVLFSITLGHLHLRFAQESAP